MKKRSILDIVRQDSDEQIALIIANEDITSFTICNVCKDICGYCDVLNDKECAERIVKMLRAPIDER